MSITYTKATNFTAKNNMATSNPDKVLKGEPFDFEFNAISDAFALAAPSLNPTFTGTATFDNLTTTGTVTFDSFTANTLSATTATVSTLNGTDPTVWDLTTATVATSEAGWDATEATVTAKSGNWDTAFGWGDHSTEGYLVAADLNGYATQTWVSTNYMAKTHAANAITTTNISNWNTAFGWGNHEIGRAHV